MEMPQVRHLLLFIAEDESSLLLRTVLMFHDGVPCFTLLGYRHYKILCTFPLWKRALNKYIKIIAILDRLL